MVTASMCFFGVVSFTGELRVTDCNTNQNQLHLPFNIYFTWASPEKRPWYPPLSIRPEQWWISRNNTNKLIMKVKVWYLPTSKSWLLARNSSVECTVRVMKLSAPSVNEFLVAPNLTTAIRSNKVNLYCLLHKTFCLIDISWREKFQFAIQQFYTI